MSSQKSQTQTKTTTKTEPIFLPTGEVDQGSGIIPRSYDEIKAIFKNNDDPSLLKQRYSFFNGLEDMVYNGVTVDDYRKGFNLPVMQETIFSHQLNDDGIPYSEIVKKIPYWEIHYYDGGFHRDQNDKKTLTPEWFSKENNNEIHFYFTLRSLISDETYEEYKKDNIIIEDFILDINAFQDVNPATCKVDKDYTGKAKDQKLSGFNIFILKDNQDNFETIKQWMPPGIWLCLTTRGGSVMPKYKPSDLPQVMFLSGGSSYLAQTENTDSIVCLDRFTNLSTSMIMDDGILKIKGNTFLNEGALVVLSKYGSDTDSYLGKNTVFGQDSIVYSEFIGNNVVLGSKVKVDNNTRLNNGCVITNGVKISRHQNVLSRQLITANPPLILSALNHKNGLTLKDFYGTLGLQKDEDPPF